MTHHAVKDQYGEWKKVTVYNEPIDDIELKDPKTGKWPACLSPRTRESFKPHYQVQTDIEDGEEFTYFRAQFFVEDMEYDTFIVEVFDVGGGECETYLHNSHDSILNMGLLHEIAHTVEEIEAVILHLSAQAKRSKDERMKRDEYMKQGKNT
jgi:hypothetical protein